MKTILRPNEERGYADHGWLKAKSTFSFAGYFDPNWMQFGPLRVMQEDVIDPSAGFDWHPHRDMEIITIVLDGKLQHRDNMGHESVITHGHVQRMSAGTGVVHSEYNASASQACHLHQIWILPNAAGIEPSYEEAFFSDAERENNLRLIVSESGESGSVSVHQDVRIYLGHFSEVNSVEQPIGDGRGLWVQVPHGEVTISGQTLRSGDGIAITEAASVTLEISADSEVIVFDVPHALD